MIKPTLKKKLESNELTIGSWISFGFTQTCEIMSKAYFKAFQKRLKTSPCHLKKISLMCSLIPLTEIRPYNLTLSWCIRTYNRLNLTLLLFLIPGPKNLILCWMPMKIFRQFMLDLTTKLLTLKRSAISA